MPDNSRNVVIVGGGFTGLASALALAKSGARVTLVEQDRALGGLAGGFDVGGVVLEKFYHHWFNNDRYVVDLVAEIGKGDRIVERPTRTGMYYAKSFYKLSSPLDLLRFTPLGIVDRIRLGLTVPQARLVRDWKKLEGLTAREWLTQICGEKVYRVVWEPLIVGKFGPYANDVSAVWIWKKIALRGGSRSSDGREVLAYYRGGFAALADDIGDALKALGVNIQLGTAATGLRVEGGRVTAVETSAGSLPADAAILTPAPPVIADLLQTHVSQAETKRLRGVDYLANLCLVLALDRSLSETYWLNVADPNFPFVGIIEHTNFEPPESYGGRHIVYLSRYLPKADPLYAMDKQQVLDFALPHIKRMFPHFDPSWILESHVWRADYAQPIMTRHYSETMPPMTTGLSNVFISTMAHVYPEDRGTNYAIREGRKVAALVQQELDKA